ncbi:mechanosensitive ion channel family protein [Breoghania sp.]|uniref:mechanosensitive ion channel family protein n=1 Tax=Breoghania sp. TaxID=2065378 RepID=UPI0029CA66D6|nr:mechanosensitive ion channel family protein [Breoghania sp.]
MLEELDKLAPAEIDRLPDPILAAGLILFAILIGYLVHRFATGIFNRTFGKVYPNLTLITKRIRPITRLVFFILALALAVPLLDVPFRFIGDIYHAMFVLMILLVGWAAILVLGVVADRYARHFRLDVEDNLQARRYITQIRVMRRVINVVIVILTIGLALMTFEPVREYGVSLFASAGVAGLVVGFAARPVLSNLIAGIQIALTQPIRIEDAVVVEGEWGWIEEIAATYVVIRIWDWRRLVVPLSYFVEKPFQNWTRESASIIGSVYWRVDYTVPVQEMREKLEELLDQSKLWDRNVVNLQVEASDERGLLVRALMTASTSPRAWDLRCEIREKMIGWLQDAYPECLPRIRAELPGMGRSPEPGMGGAAVGAQMAQVQK